MMFLSAPALETERLRLRHYELQDFEGFADLLGSPRSKFMDGPVGRSEAWNRFAAGAGQWSLVGYGAWAIEHKKTEACLGVVSLNYPTGTSEKELGWALWMQFSGQGFALEAARCARRFAFETLGWNDMVSYIASPNHASIRLAERLGAELDQTATDAQKDNTLVYRHRSCTR